MMRGRAGWPLRALVLALVVAACAGVVWTRMGLTRAASAVRDREDVYVLPPPAHLRAMTLGHRAAATDMLWAKLLVEYGSHWADKRPFVIGPRYVDALIALEPDFAPLYTYVATLLVYRPPRGTEDDAHQARAYLEQGTRHRPYDPRVWTELGQFVAFIGPSFLSAPEERERWRRDGANALLRAAELGAAPYGTMAAASILSRSGERAAAKKALLRTYALADDPLVRDEILAKLRHLDAAEEEAMAVRAGRVVESHRREALPFVPRGLFVLVGPVPDAARCAGPRPPPPEEQDAPDPCATSWPARWPAATQPPFAP